MLAMRRCMRPVSSNSHSRYHNYETTCRNYRAIHRKSAGYPVVAKRPDLFDQPIVQLTLPFAREKCLDGFAATDELGAVAPGAIQRIGKRDFWQDRECPGVLSEARLPRSGLGCKGGKGGRVMSIPACLSLRKRRLISTARKQWAQRFDC